MRGVDLLRKWTFGQAVIADRNLRPTTKLAAIALLNFLNSESGECFPSYDTLGARLAISRRTAMRAVEELVTAGWFEVVAPSRGRRSNRYAPALARALAPETVTTPTPLRSETVTPVTPLEQATVTAVTLLKAGTVSALTPSTAETVTILTPNGDSGVTPTVSAVSPKPIKGTHLLNPVRGKRSRQLALAVSNDTVAKDPWDIIDDIFIATAKIEAPSIPSDTLPWHLRAYRDHLKAHGKRVKDPRAGFMGWLRREHRFAVERAQRTAGRPPSAPASPPRHVSPAERIEQAIARRDGR